MHIYLRLYSAIKRRNDDPAIFFFFQIFNPTKKKTKMNPDVSLSKTDNSFYSFILLAQEKPIVSKLQYKNCNPNRSLAVEMKKRHEKNETEMSRNVIRFWLLMDISQV